MAVEILSVSLDEATIAKLANEIAERILRANHSVTLSNPPSSQNPQPAERSGFQGEARAPQNSDDGWSQPQVHNATGGNHGAPSTAPQNDQEGPPTCQCGDAMRWVPPGYSERSGKSYKGFWACPRPRGQQCAR